MSWVQARQKQEMAQTPFPFIVIYDIASENEANLHGITDVYA